MHKPCPGASSNRFELDPCGAQLTYTYTIGIRRNDQALFHYGFIQESDPPALVEQDLPDGNLYDVSSYSEADYGETPPAVLMQRRGHAVSWCRKYD